jgi:hypothetical protein
MNIIRNLNDRARVAVYATAYIVMFALAVAAVVFGLELLSNLIGQQMAFAAFFGSLTAYIAISTAVMMARFRVEKEQRTEREVIRRMQSTQ